ncbi:MAG TPA: BatA domain-containing protein [Gemmatimonadales bacterium]|nr:BatA domain-containing protein [Gemmatimonadales bacterium]
MTFATPWALVGLLAAAIPVLLHLVERRQPPEQAFPAIRYLEDATRDQRRRLRLRHLLLLVLRTLAIVALVLAAAGARLSRTAPLGAHSPMALVLVLDNSASSATVVEGEALLTGLVREARAVLARATPADRLWLLLADGVARPGTAAELGARLDAVTVEGSRLDLGAAVRQADGLIAGTGRAGEIVVVTDAQRTAVSPATTEARIVVLRPTAAVPVNRSLAGLDPGPLPWAGAGGRLRIAVGASDSTAVPLRLEVPGLAGRDVLVSPGVPAVQRLELPTPGWHLVRATLPPDEFRLDDAASVAVRVAPPAAVTWDPADPFVDAAMRVLRTEGRVRDGAAVTVGRLGQAASVVVPPEDPARIGALNRALAARGVAWRYGSGSVAPSRTDSSTWLVDRIDVARHVGLEASGPGADTLVTIAGAPWLVRSGDVVLFGSRLEPAWTSLPIDAAFVPLLDALVTRVVRGEPVVPRANAGAAIDLPAAVTSLIGPEGPLAVEGGAPWRPPGAGSYWLVAGADTLGALSVTIDPRESALARATDDEVTDAWPEATIADLAGGAGRTFAAGGRGDLRPLLLLLVLLAVAAESVIAGRLTAVR